MATADKDGMPHVSYAPFVQRAASFYVYTSSLSQHTKNMMEVAKASVMFIADEKQTRNFFARKRFTCICGVGVAERESEEWLAVMSLFENKFGEMFGMIRPLPDFTLFRLNPDGGLYVHGFGQAFRISPDMRVQETSLVIALPNRATFSFVWQPIGETEEGMMGRSMMGMQDCPMMGGSGQGMMGSEMMAGGATSGPHPSSSGTRSRGKRRVLGQIIDDLCRPSLE